MVDERKQIEAFQNLVRLFEMVHIDNLRILKALLYSKDDLPLIDGTTRRKVWPSPSTNFIPFEFVAYIYDM